MSKKISLLVLPSIIFSPTLSAAREIRETVLWCKPDIVITVDEACLDRAIKRNIAFINAKFLGETAGTMKVKCTYYKP